MDHKGYWIILLMYCTLSLHAQRDTMLKWDFVYLDEVLHQSQYEVRYHGINNFIGKKIDGYHSDRLVMTSQAAAALQKAEHLLDSMGLGLHIYDTYRPQRAVDHFQSWANNPSDTLTKAIFYPDQKKKDLFHLGYIASRSGHSRGSTIDLTIYALDDGLPIDMGGAYDFFGIISHHGYEAITLEQKANRILLKNIMAQCGFRSYDKEWWHYTLVDEPYPDRYFDFIVESE